MEKGKNHCIYEGAYLSMALVKHHGALLYIRAYGLDKHYSSTAC